MKRSLRPSAVKMISPRARAAGASSGPCRLCLACADCVPAVTLPSTQSVPASWLRKCATCSAGNRAGIWTIILERGLQRDGHRAARRRGGAIAEGLAVIKPVGQVHDIDLGAPGLVERIG